MKVIWERKLEIYRDPKTTMETYRANYYPFGDVSIFDGCFPQHKIDVFRGTVSIIRFLDYTDVLHMDGGPGPKIRCGKEVVDTEPAGVMEALFVGERFLPSIPGGREFLAPGSIFCFDSRNWFCPRVFFYGSHLRQPSIMPYQLSRMGDALHLPVDTDVLLIKPS